MTLAFWADKRIYLINFLNQPGQVLSCFFGRDLIWHDCRDHIFVDGYPVIAISYDTEKTTLKNNVPKVAKMNQMMQARRPLINTSLISNIKINLYCFHT